MTRREENEERGLEATVVTPSASTAPTTAPVAISGIEPTLAPDGLPTQPLALDTSAPTVAQTGPDSPTHREGGGGPARPSQSLIRPPSRPSVKDNRYVLGAEIARGGMGRVVDATDNLLGRGVAIKEALSTDEDLRVRFLRETKITARLEHPSIVPVYDAGTSPDGSPFYVMRRVSGKPLEKLVQEATGVTQRLGLLPNLLAAANAVAHAHSRGVVHRDIKPSNILVGEHGETVVIDWGLAKLVDDSEDVPSSARLPPSAEDNAVHTRIGSIVGTPGFMPPEQLLGEVVDPRSDVYALGATLYFLLSGRAPHAARTGEEMMNAALAGPPTPVRNLVAGVPPELATIIDKALAHERRDRYHDAGGLAADLDRFLKGQLVAAHRYSRRERLLRFWRRHRLAISIATIAALMLVVGGTFSITRIVDARHRAATALADALVRNELLELGRARATARTQPRKALELLRPLAEKHWQEARAIALAARAKGVPRVFPNAPYVQSLDLSQDGMRGISVGEDSVLREHDLAHRTTREIARLSGRFSATFIDGDRSLVLYDAKRVRLFDLATKTERELFRGPMLTPKAHGRTLWWIEGDNPKFRAWSRSLDETENKVVPIDDIMWAVAPGPKAVAFGGEHHLWVMRDGVATSLADGPVHSVRWLDDNNLLAIVKRRPLIIDVRDNSEHPIPYAGDARDVFPAWNGTFVVRGMSGRISVFRTEGLVELPPLNWASTLLVTPNSPFVLTGIDGDLFVWDLRELLPTVTTLGAGFEGGEAAHEQLLAHHDDGTASWVDLRTGSVKHMPLTGRVLSASFSEDGKRLCTCDYEGHGRYFERDRDDSLLLDVPCSRSVWAHDVLVFNAGADIHAFDAKTRTTKRVFQASEGVWSFHGAGDWVLGIFGDNSAWRYNVVTGQSTTLPASDLDRWMLLRDDGSAYFDDGDVIRTWNVDGTVGRTYTLPSRPGELRWTDATHVFVRARGDAGYVLDLVTGEAVLAYPSGSQFNEVALEGELGASVNEEGALMLMMPFTGDAWMMGRPVEMPFWRGRVSKDHSHAYAVAGGNLLTWDVPFPTTREATLSLIDELLR